VRQFIGGKAVLVVAGLSALPCIFALIYFVNPDVDLPRRFITGFVYTDTVMPTLLPFTVLILATAALGNEIEDRTLPYLTLKPIGRLRIILGKLAGTVLVAAPIMLGALTATYLIVFRGDSGDNLRILGAIAASAFVAIIAYSAIFILLSLLITRALVVGIIYSLVWESLLGRFLPGLRVVSVRHFTRSIFVGVLNDPRVAMDNATSTNAAILTLLIVSAMAVILATWRLRNMNLD
jgi:ABC-2 type transport system permease protein